MRSWLHALRRTLAPDLGTESDASVERPQWVDELLDAIQKQSRASVKQGARLEAALAESESRVRALHAALEQQRAPEREADARAAAREHAPLFDALDALDEARRLVAEPHLDAGLALVAERVLSYCEHAGFERLGTVGSSPDPRLLRIVGSEPRVGVPPGHVSRVVRAAIVHGELLVREGEVIVSATQSQEESSNGQLGN